MTRDDERIQRAQEGPIVGGLPDVPGILTALNLTPRLGVHLRGLADELLVHDFEGATLRRAQREMLATAVSAGNDCFFCMDSHAAHATALLERDGDAHLAPLLDELKIGSLEPFDPKMRALLHIAANGSAQPARACGGRCRGGQGGRSDRSGRPARRPHRGGVLDVQPPGRRVPRHDAADDGGLPGACRPDRRARVQRSAGRRAGSGRRLSPRPGAERVPIGPLVDSAPTARRPTNTIRASGGTADAPALGAGVARRASSNLASPTSARRELTWSPFPHDPRPGRRWSSRSRSHRPRSTSTSRPPTGTLPSGPRVPGFRPGKAPRQVIDRFVGRGSVLAEAIDHLVSDAYDRGAGRDQDHPDRPAEGRHRPGTVVRGAGGHLHRDRAGAPGRGARRLHRLPVRARDPRGHRRAGGAGHRRAAASSRPPCARSTAARAAEGDIASVKFVGSIDGEPFEGGSADRMPLVIGEDRMIAGWEDQLVGMGIGDDEGLRHHLPR